MERVFPHLTAILRFSLGECTNNGMSARYESIEIFPLGTDREQIDKWVEEHPNTDKKRLALVKENKPFYPIVVPAYPELYEQERNVKGAWFPGGNFADTIMGHAEEWTGGCKFPLSIHDRFESWEEYYTMSQ